MKSTHILTTLALSLLALWRPASAALILNPAQPISQVVNVQVIAVANDAGSNPAPLFGTPAEQATIFALVDQIWAQAGIDVDFTFRSGTYNSTFALSGTPGLNNPRSTDDLSTIINNATIAGGVISANPNTINMFMVQIVPGFSQTDANISNGLAFVPGNGITMWAGPTMLGYLDGQEAMARVLAHEIGHNLGLSHIVETDNLLESGGVGERLNSTQISTALASSLTVPIPEPSTMAAACALAALAFVRYRRRPLLPRSIE